MAVRLVFFQKADIKDTLHQERSLKTEPFFFLGFSGGNFLKRTCIRAISKGCTVYITGILDLMWSS